jgi:hypothetical protein
MRQRALLITFLHPWKCETVQHPLGIDLLQQDSMRIGEILESQEFAKETINIVSMMNSSCLMDNLFNYLDRYLLGEWVDVG